MWSPPGCPGRWHPRLQRFSRLSLSSFAPRADCIIFPKSLPTQKCSKPRRIMPALPAKKVGAGAGMRHAVAFALTCCACNNRKQMPAAQQDRCCLPPVSTMVTSPWLAPLPVGILTAVVLTWSLTGTVTLLHFGDTKRLKHNHGGRKRIYQ